MIASCEHQRDAKSQQVLQVGLRFADISVVGPIAQSVEQRTFNPWVDGSSPSGPTFSGDPVSRVHRLNKMFVYKLYGWGLTLYSG